MAGKTDRIADYIADFTAEKDKAFPAGTYRLVFRDEAGKDVSSPIDVKIEVMDEETEISVGGFKLDDANPITNPSEVRFSFYVRCTSGYYYSDLQLYLFPGDGGDDVYHKSTERIYLTKGDTREVTVTADLDRLTDVEYMALIYKGSEPMSSRIYLKIDRTSGVSEIYYDQDDPMTEIYDLSGRRVTDLRAGGFYIANGHKVIIAR